MVLPFLLIFFAVASVAVVAYGMHPAWGKYPHGVEYIMTIRQWEWPLIALAIILCLGLAGLVAAGKRKAWWLLGLLPVLVLIGHYLFSDPMRQFSMNDAPTFVSADKAAGLADDDYVVGLRFNNAYFAYPYATLYSTPLLVQTDHDKRLVLIWSAFANRAVASEAEFASFHPKDLEIVSMPANGLLVYNHKTGQFLNPITGLTMGGEKPKSFKESLPTWKMTWKAWRMAHPETQVMAPRTTPSPQGHNRPEQPYFEMPPVSSTFRPETQIMLVPGVLQAGEKPIGIDQSNLATLKQNELNLATPDMPLLLVRVPDTGEIRMFDRRLSGYAEAPRFAMHKDPKTKAYVLTDDAHEQSVWDLAGKPIGGPAQRLPDQRTLKRVPFDDHLYWGVTKVWLPDLRPVLPAPVK